MLYLKFTIAGQWYGLPAADIIELVPRLELTRILGVPDYIAGYFNYRGESVPVVELAKRAAGQPATDAISTRIVIVRYRDRRKLGLLLENATEIVELDPDTANWQTTGVQPSEAYWGDVSLAGNEALQLVKIDQLLPEDVRAILYDGQEAKSP